MAQRGATALERIDGYDPTASTLVAVCFVLLAVGSIEAAWRLSGYRPSVTDSPALWAYHRRQAVERSGKIVALLGTSRMLTDFSTDAFHRRYPGCRIAQLGIQAS